MMQVNTNFSKHQDYQLKSSSPKQLGFGQRFPTRDIIEFIIRKPIQPEETSRAKHLRRILSLGRFMLEIPEKKAANDATMVSKWTSDDHEHLRAIDLVRRKIENSLMEQYPGLKTIKSEAERLKAPGPEQGLAKWVKSKITEHLGGAKLLDIEPIPSSVPASSLPAPNKIRVETTPELSELLKNRKALLSNIKQRFENGDLW